MRSCNGTSAAHERSTLALAVALAASALTPAPARAIDFDAVFYRARAGFDFCYAFTGTAGWSLRAIAGGRITHDARDPCPTSGLDASALAASADCTGGACHADCASFVRRAWAAGADLALRPLGAPTGGNCASPSSFGGEHYAAADAMPAALVAALADARPGDWCSHADHVVMLVRRAAPRTSRWLVWEANSAAVGIGQGSVALDATWLRTIVRDDCRWTLGPGPGGTWRAPERAWAESGCWHPPAERTGPPEELALIAGGGVIVQDGVLPARDPSDVALRWRRPEGLPALADYLVWIRWRSGGSDAAPTWEHRLVRVPAFSRRDDPDRRVASFPELPLGVREVPLDIDEASVVEVRWDALATAPAAVVHGFRNPTTGTTPDAWQPGQGLAPIVPASFGQDGVVFVPGRSYAWRVRVERYGELSADGRERVAVIPACRLDAQGVEQVAYCRDPMWSEEQRFTLVCASVDDSCPRSGPTHGEACTAAPARPEDAWTSGCAAVALGATEVHAGDLLDVAVTTSSGICAGARAWAAPADYAVLGGVESRDDEPDQGVYDFCTAGPEQPEPASYDAIGLALPDDWSGTVRFHVPAAAVGACVDYIGPESGGLCCPYGGDCAAHGVFEGPLVVVGGGGGTHGWSTARMFTVVPARITADPGTP